MRIHKRRHACSGPPDYVAQTADAPTDGFGGSFLSYFRADSSWLSGYQNYFDRFTSTVSLVSCLTGRRILPQLNPTPFFFNLTLRLASFFIAHVQKYGSASAPIPHPYNSRSLYFRRTTVMAISRQMKLCQRYFDHLGIPTVDIMKIGTTTNNGRTVSRQSLRMASFNSTKTNTPMIIGKNTTSKIIKRTNNQSFTHPIIN